MINLVASIVALLVSVLCGTVAALGKSPEMNAFSSAVTLCFAVVSFVIWKHRNIRKEHS